MNKLVSILICTYNAEKTIEETLNSCLTQTYQSFEILIHDDQSKDKTIETIKKIGDNRIKIIESGKKLGPYKGLNFLLDHAKGEYIAIQDHDDLWKPEKLEKQVKFLEENKKYVGCGTRTLMWYEGDNKCFDYYLGKETYYTLHPSLMFRNEGYRYIEDRVYMGDALFQKKVLCKGKNIIGNIDEILTIHRVKKGAENYSYKWFKFTKKNLNTIYSLHGKLYGTEVLGWECMRKIVYPVLHLLKIDGLIDKIERVPYRLEGYKIKSTTKGKITKHMIGRLGNQMFQYAAVRAFQIKNGYKENQLFLDFSEVYKRSNEKFYNDLKDFNIKCFQENHYKNTIVQAFLVFCINFLKYVCLFTTKRDYYDIKFYKLGKKFQPLLNKFGLYIFRLGFCDFKDSNAKDKIFYGTFESAKYFDDIRDVLLKEFTPKYDILAHNIDLYNEINSTESVCVTIRRGDFMSKGNKSRFYVCTPEYFYEGIKYIQQNIKNPKFFIFSDDVERCKKNMKFPFGTLFESGTDPVWEKLRLMYSCKHFIISNSTFSWWAQYLSRNKNKLVIAPKIWWNDKSYKEKLDIYMDSWILI